MLQYLVPRRTHRTMEDERKDRFRGRRKIMSLVHFNQDGHYSHNHICKSLYFCPVQNVPSQKEDYQ